MEPVIEVGPAGEVAASLYRQLLDAVRDGRLVPGERLPSSRDLARRLGISRGTVLAVYDRLAAEEVVEARHGSGTYVPAQVLPAPRRSAPHG
ncbi:MAG TPA: winged helix-turn-helix domain-containing protein, partial [Propionibacteriaceae bacterium]|nr:winged helix-turn-helix domain-containing protein [Propionibacteriaceae bacterium]